MFHRLFAIFFTILAAVGGAMLGRLVADARRQSDLGEDPHFETDPTALRPRDVMPGLVAALRVRDRPWSFLHIPSWFAAFSVNFAFAALGRELGPLLRTLRGDSGSDDPMYAEPGAPTPWGEATPAPATMPPGATA